jgi:Fe-S cluster assembly protein SufD
MRGGSRGNPAESWIQAFPAFAAALGDNPQRQAQRERALAAFGELGLPSTRLEAWRSTNLGTLEKRMPPAPTGHAPEAGLLEKAKTQIALEADRVGEASLRAVFIDGHFCSSLSSLPEDESAIRVLSIRPESPTPVAFPQGYGELAPAKRDAFSALNEAFTPGIEVLEFGEGCEIDLPVHLVFLSSGDGRLNCPRLHVTGKKQSRATLILDFLSVPDGENLVSSVTEIFLEERAHLDCVVAERESDRTVHIANLQARQGRESGLRIHTLTLGGALVRNELGVELADLGAELDLNGLYVGSGDQHQDNHTRVDHATPRTTSRELYKGILADNARGVFRGLIHVRPDAQKIDSTQSNMNLLLSPGARVDTRPQLEIYADDVKCSHGSTIGKLDEEALFYLRSRGLSPSEARAMLTRGFVAEICDALPLEPLRTAITELVLEKLSACVHPGGEGVA